MKKLFLVLTSFFLLFSVSCKNEKNSNVNIAVFIPGIMADSPTYDNLAKGVSAAVESFNANNENNKAELRILEAGTNQSEWSDKIISLAATQKYDVIISSNPSLPDLVEPILEQFPKQKFILLDATKENNPNIMTICYNQYEQSFLTGYIAGLMSKSHKIALVAAQEYPVMNNIILPYYQKGAASAVKGTSVDFRIVGNWYDAAKGSEITDSVVKTGVDVVLPICGGASQGVLSSAVNNNIKVCWFDANGFSKSESTIISSTVLKQKELAEIVTSEFLKGNTKWGTASMVGLEDGFVEFIEDYPSYTKNVPEDIRKKMSLLINDIRTKKIDVTK